MIAKHISHYRILSQLGAGGMGRCAGRRPEFGILHRDLNPGKANSNAD